MVKVCLGGLRNPVSGNRTEMRRGGEDGNVCEYEKISNANELMGSTDTAILCVLFLVNIMKSGFQRQYIHVISHLVFTYPCRCSSPPWVALLHTFSSHLAGLCPFPQLLSLSSFVTHVSHCLLLFPRASVSCSCRQLCL